MSTPFLDSQIARRTTKRFVRPGFSLIELTAVLVILGLLMAGAAIAVPNQIKRARIRVTKTSMTTIKTSINTYMADHAGDAPATLAELIPQYVEQGSEIDAWDQQYYYIATPGTAHPFELISSGNDKEFQTPDDIDLWKMDIKSGN